MVTTMWQYFDDSKIQRFGKDWPLLQPVLVRSCPQVQRLQRVLAHPRVLGALKGKAEELPPEPESGQVACTNLGSVATSCTKGHISILSECQWKQWKHVRMMDGFVVISDEPIACWKLAGFFQCGGSIKKKIVLQWFCRASSSLESRSNRGFPLWWWRRRTGWGQFLFPQCLSEI